MRQKKEIEDINTRTAVKMNVPAGEGDYNATTRI
jgi:hypothetical protein